MLCLAVNYTGSCVKRVYINDEIYQYVCVTSMKHESGRAPRNAGRDSLHTKALCTQHVLHYTHSLTQHKTTHYTVVHDAHVQHVIMTLSAMKPESTPMTAVAQTSSHRSVC